MSHELRFPLSDEYILEAISESSGGTAVKKTYTGLTSAAAHNLTDSAHGYSPAANTVKTLRVTAGTAAAGPRIVTDTSGSPSTTVATISDDGKTITFEAGVTGFVISYIALAS